MSSTKQKTAINLEKKIKSKGGYFLDAPVSGGTLAAKSGKLAIMVGGEKKIFLKTKHILMKKGRHFTVSLIDGLWLFHRKVYYIISIIIYFIAKSAYAPVPCSAMSNPLPFLLFQLLLSQQLI